MKCSILVALSLFAGSALASSSHSSSDLDHTKRFDKVLRATPEGEIDGGLAVRDGPEKMGLAKRATNGRMSFFAPGLGACGSYSNAGDFMVASESKLAGYGRSRGRRARANRADSPPTVNGAQYGNMGAISDWCFQTITISYGTLRSAVFILPSSTRAVHQAQPAHVFPLFSAGGRSHTATVLDACPGVLRELETVTCWS